MKIINGQFVDDNGNVIPVEIGNIEQIRLLKEYENLTKDGVPIKINIEEKPTYLLKAEWTCPKCNHEHDIEDSEIYEDFEPDNDDIENFLNGEICSCEKCGESIEVETNKEKIPNKYSPWKFITKLEEPD